MKRLIIASVLAATFGAARCFADTEIPEDVTETEESQESEDSEDEEEPEDTPPSAPDVCADAYLWLDASKEETIITNDVGAVTNWVSVNTSGKPATLPTLSSNQPTGPSIVYGGLNSLDVLSFGSNTNKIDLSFARTTEIRAVFMVTKMQLSANAFLLGDTTAYNFHRGTGGQFWTTHTSDAIKATGKTYLNGYLIESPTTAYVPERFGLIEVMTSAGVTASTLCYDRTIANRWGGKDIAELLIFTEELTDENRLAVEAYLMKKWGLYKVYKEPVEDSPFSVDETSLYELEKNFSVTTDSIQLGNANDVIERVVQKSGDILVTNDGEGTTTGNSPVILGHWGYNHPSVVIYDLLGGTFTATNSPNNAVYFGADGKAVLTIGGSDTNALMDVSGIGQDSARTQASVLSVLANGTLRLGAGGINFQNPNASVNITDGTLIAANDCSVSVAKTDGLTLSGNVTLAAEPNAALTIASPYKGDAQLTIAGGGTVVLTGFDATDPAVYHPPTIASVIDGTRLVLEITVRGKSLAAETPVDALPIPPGATIDRMAVRFRNATTGGVVSATLEQREDGTLVATPITNVDKRVTYTPTEDGSFTWNFAEGAFDGETFGDFNDVAFIGVQKDSGEYVTTEVNLPTDIWAGRVEIGGGVKLSGGLLRANEIAVKDGVFEAPRIGEAFKYVRLTISSTQTSGKKPAVAEFRMYRDGQRLDWPKGTMIRDNDTSDGSWTSYITKETTDYPGHVGTSNEKQTGCLIDGYYGNKETDTGYPKVHNTVARYKYNKWWPQSNANGPWIVELEFPHPIAGFDGCNFCLADEAERNPTSWTIEVSADGEEWQLVNETVGATWTAQYAWNGDGEDDIAFPNDVGTSTSVTITNATVVAKGVWMCDVDFGPNTVIQAVPGGELTLAAGSNVKFYDETVFDLRQYTAASAGKHYIVTGEAADWPEIKNIIGASDDLKFGRDEAGYYVVIKIDRVVSDGETCVLDGLLINTLTVKAGGTVVFQGTVQDVLDSVTFEEGSKLIVREADGSTVAYTGRVTRNILTAPTITGTPTVEDYFYAAVLESDEQKTLFVERSHGSARVIRAHPLLTRGVGRESLIGLDFSGAWGGAISSITFRFRFVNCTASNLGDLKLWRLSKDSSYAFRESNSTELTSYYDRKNTSNADKTELTITYTLKSGVSPSTSHPTWVFPENDIHENCSRIWMTGVLLNLDTLRDDAHFYIDVLDDEMPLSGNKFAVENGIAKAPHRLYPYRYRVTAYMRADRMSGTSMGKLENATAKRFKSLTHVISSSYSAVYDSSTDTVKMQWNDKATATFKRLKYYRDLYHPQCRLVPSMVKGSMTNGRWAISLGGDKKRRAAFVKNIVKTLEDNNCDGLDIDWEYPADQNGTDAKNYGLLMRDLAEAFFDHGWDLSMCTNLGYMMPNVNGVMDVPDYISSMAYGANRGLHSMNVTMSAGISTCTSRKVHPRRIACGQAIYSTAMYHMGWDEIGGKVGYDDDIIKESWSYNGATGNWIGFTGPTTYRAKSTRCRGQYSDGVEYGGIMSWGYYCDVGYDSKMSLGMHQEKVMYPRPYNWPTPEQDDDGTYLLDSEEDWFWFAENATNSTKVSKAKLTGNIRFEHDPMPVPSFSGTFDGQGYTLTIPEMTWICAYDKVGLFKTLTGTVKNLNIDFAGRVIVRNDRRNDTQSGWSLSNHGGPGANAGVLVAEANSGSRIENVSLLLRNGSEVRGNHNVGALIGQIYTTGEKIVLTNITVDCYGKVHARAVDSINNVINSGNGKTGDGRVGLVGGTLNFESNSHGVELTDVTAYLRGSGQVNSASGNNRTTGGLVGNLQLGANPNFKYGDLHLTVEKGAFIGGDKDNSSNPYRSQIVFGYYYGTSGSTQITLGKDCSVLVSTALTGVDTALFHTGEYDGDVYSIQKATMDDNKFKLNIESFLKSDTTLYLKKCTDLASGSWETVKTYNSGTAPSEIELDMSDEKAFYKLTTAEE